MSKAQPAGESVPQSMLPAYEAVVALTDQFCREHLDEEWAQLCRKMAAGLARKRPSPLVGGKASTWAAGIVYAAGQINFLFDKANPHYMTADQIAAAFGISKSTAGSKAKAVRDALKINTYDWHWALPSRQADYPGAWLILVDGLAVDARTVSRAIQEEAFRKGLIPFVPGPRDRSEEG